MFEVIFICPAYELVTRNSNCTLFISLIGYHMDEQTLQHLTAEFTSRKLFILNFTNYTLFLVWSVFITFLP